MALTSTRGCSPAPEATPSGVSYSLPVDLTVLPWMATSSAAVSGPQPHLPCLLQVPTGEEDLCHSHGSGQLLFVIVMENL